MTDEHSDDGATWTRTCSTCGGIFEVPAGNYAMNVSTRGAYGRGRHKLTVAGVAVHECPPLPDLLRAERSTLEVLLA